MTGAQVPGGADDARPLREGDEVTLTISGTVREVWEGLREDPSLHIAVAGVGTSAGCLVMDLSAVRAAAALAAAGSGEAPRGKRRGRIVLELTEAQADGLWLLADMANIDVEETGAFDGRSLAAARRGLDALEAARHGREPEPEPAEEAPGRHVPEGPLRALAERWADLATDDYLRGVGSVLVFHSMFDGTETDDAARHVMCENHLTSVDREGRPLVGDGPSMASALSDMELRLLTSVEADG